MKVPAYRPISQPPSEHHAISVRPISGRQTAVPKKIRTPATCRRSGMIHACRSVSVRHKSTIHRSIPRSANTETSNRYTIRQHEIPKQVPPRTIPPGSLPHSNGICPADTATKTAAPDPARPAHARRHHSAISPLGSKPPQASARQTVCETAEGTAEDKCNS